MPNGPCQAEILLSTITFGGVDLGVSVGFSLEEIVQDIVIRGEAVTGPSCRGIIHRDAIATVHFLSPPVIPPTCVKGALVITTLDAQCPPVSHVKTLGAGDNMMVPRGYSVVLNRESPPAIYSQTFVAVGDFGTAAAFIDPITLT